jgi:arylsulfatase A-like enzyme
MMRDAGYRTATIGKWHSGVDSDPANAWEQAPSLFGFDDTVVPWPVPATCAPPGSQNTLPDFSARLRDGFLSWWTANEGTPRFAMVSFEAAHSPWSFPIASLLPAHYPPPPALRQFATDRDKAEAEMVGMDTAIGSMLAVLGPEDIVIFLGDNGTSEGAVRSDQDPTRVKLTCYEDGVRVPFIISGPSIPAGSTFDDISHVVDILPTLRGMLGLQGPPVDGAMLTSQAHDMVFCHGPDRLDAAAISAHWKLLTTEDGTEHLFDRFVDPLETAPISATGPIANYLRTRRIAALGH